MSKKWRDLQHKLHGTVPFEGESMQEGSQLNEHGLIDSPPIQVNLYEKGFLTTPFIGCGLRLNTYLVVPTHVVRGVKTIIAENPASGLRMEVNVPRVPSKAIPDLSYFQLPDSWWSQLGTRSGPTRSIAEGMALRSTPAVVVSRQKSSTGSVMPCPNNVHKVVFTGSTIPGFSGAAYMANGRVLGMHQGVYGSMNVGFLWEAIVTDIRYLFRDDLKPALRVQGEGAQNRSSGKGGYDDEDLVPAASKGRAWGYRDLHAQIQSVYADSCDWAEDCDVDYDANLVFEGGRKVDGVVNDMCSNIEGLPVAHLEVLLAKIEAEVKKKHIIVGQNENSTTVDGGSTLFGQALSTARSTAETIVEQRVRPLEKRIEALEAKLSVQQLVPPAKAAQPIKKAERKIKCDLCDKTFYTPLGLRQHKSMFVHGEKKPVPFLGKKKPQSSLPILKSTSSTLVKGKECSQATTSQQSSQDTQKQFEGILERILEAINGLKSAPEPSSKA